MMMRMTMGVYEYNMTPDCDFYCCDEFIHFCDLDEYTIKEMKEILGIKFCPYCGYNLKSL